MKDRHSPFNEPHEFNTSSQPAWFPASLHATTYLLMLKQPGINKAELHQKEIQMFQTIMLHLLLCIFHYSAYYYSATFFDAPLLQRTSAYLHPSRFKIFRKFRRLELLFRIFEKIPKFGDIPHFPTKIPYSK